MIDCFHRLHIVDDSIILDAKLLNHVVKLCRESKIIPCYIQATSNGFYMINNYLSKDGSYATIFIQRIHETHFGFFLKWLQYILKSIQTSIYLSFSMVCVDMFSLYSRKITPIGALCRFSSVERQDDAFVYSTCVSSSFFFNNCIWFMGFVKVLIDGKQHGDETEK